MADNKRPIELGRPAYIDFPGPVDDGGMPVPVEMKAETTITVEGQDDVLVRALTRDQNARAVLAAAMIRGAYSAIGTFAATFVAMLLMDVDTTKALLTATVAALAILGFRGAVEGKMDADRAKAGEVKQSDVGAAG